MSDIIEELRASAFVLPREKCIPEAANEIARLREENARLREVLDDAFAQWDGDWPEDLVARVKAAILGKVKAEAACPEPDEAP